MIDSHAHLTDEKFAGDVDEVVGRAALAGVDTIVTIATDVEDARAAIELAERHAGVYATAGIHPHSASAATPAALEALRGMAAHPRVVAIGETGLDYHYDFSPRDAQRHSFRRQLELAAELELPVVVHAREADEDMVALVGELGAACRGVLHCFSSGAELLDTALEAGWHVSFAGMITFKNFDAADLLRAVPLERLLIETDSPYLAPTPHRGKRNEPGFVVRVAERAAELRGEDPGRLAEQTAANARALYRLPA